MGGCGQEKLSLRYKSMVPPVSASSVAGKLIWASEPSSAQFLVQALLGRRGTLQVQIRETHQRVRGPGLRREDGLKVTALGARWEPDLRKHRFAPGGLAKG